MATETIPAETGACKEPGSTYDLGMAEQASATLYETGVLVAAADSFTRELKAWLEVGRSNPGADATLLQLDTMLLVIADYVEKAKGEIDGFVADAMASGRKPA